jgi:Mg2+/Co2+ transporter CorC
VRDRLGAQVPDGSAYETVGGYVMSVLGRVPVVGDEVYVPAWSVQVHSMDGRRVDRLRFTPLPDEPEQHTTDPAKGLAAGQDVRRGRPERNDRPEPLGGADSG